MLFELSVKDVHESEILELNDTVSEKGKTVFFETRLPEQEGFMVELDREGVIKVRDWLNQWLEENL